MRGGVVRHVVEEEADRHIHRLRNVPQTGSTDAVHSGFVLLDLLELDADFFSQLLLSHPNHPSAVTNSLADVHIHRMFHGRAPYSFNVHSVSTFSPHFSTCLFGQADCRRAVDNDFKCLAINPKKQA